MLEAYELGAREYLESRTGRVLTSSTFTVYLDEFPDCFFYFSNGPVSSIESIEYLVAGVWAVASSDIYLMGRGDLFSQGVVKVVDKTWPTDKDSQIESVRINYTAGAANRRANQAIKMMVAHWFENRETASMGEIKEVPYAVKSIINNLKSFTVK